MAINFPNNPAVNDTFTVGGTTFTFTGVKWETSAVVEISSDLTPSLGGTLDAGTHNINNVGIITATTFSGNLTGNAQGLTGDPSIQVTNATVLGNLDVQGTTTTIDTAITEVDSLNVEGSVGIGTTNPSRKLVVQDSGNTFLSVKAGTSDDVGVIFGDTDNDARGLVRYANNGDSLQLWTAGSEKVRIDSNGDVGIGIADPQERLHVARIVMVTGNTPQIRLNANDSDASDDDRTMLGQATGNGNFVTSAVDNDTILRGTSTGNLLFGIGTAEKLRISSDGQATFNKGAPGGANQVIARFQAESTRRLDIVWHDSGSLMGFDTPSNHSYIFKTGGTERLRIDSSGNVVATGSISDSIGDVRRLDIVSSSVDLTLSAASHAGRLIRMTSTNRTFTIPSGSFSSGDMITIFHVGTGNMTIAQGSSVTLYNAADGATGNRTLAAKGMVTIACTDGPSNEFVISGSQLT